MCHQPGHMTSKVSNLRVKYWRFNFIMLKLHDVKMTLHTVAADNDRMV